ncbi:pyruvate formate-lyase-activating protein [Gracilimonas mengyeensis]|uniref:Pyruvate formate-lyase-activating enzyme n=1 Tax=Gracilimonas mengyeensis TaxID=1302730 RepID=A0A521C6R8_9BACT|nr:pyruvate formate-lyase-activating protein [Gracilimonas mengyeensis]SMO55119.1 pyruvate formate lyase activating enzyme [Gracilimonas mengyeensis]
MENVTGYLHSVETAGTLDGPGIRRVLFLNGCPLKCVYCHNPDTRRYKGGTQTDAYTELRAIAKQKEMLFSMKGGVTISGGEPLWQPEFVKTVFEGCKMMGLHTALDTSGFLGPKADDELLSFTDLVLLDIKHFEPEGYKRVTGVDLQPTLDFAERLAFMNRPVWLRFVLVPGYTDHMDAIRKMAGYLYKLGNVERVEVLPFHKMGEYKWEALDMNYELFDIEEPTTDLITETKAQFEKEGLVVY